jgi:hypothetical protein
MPARSAGVSASLTRIVTVSLIVCISLPPVTVSTGLGWHHVAAAPPAEFEIVRPAWLTAHVAQVVYWHVVAGHDRNTASWHVVAGHDRNTARASPMVGGRRMYVACASLQGWHSVMCVLGPAHQAACAGPAASCSAWAALRCMT